MPKAELDSYVEFTEGGEFLFKLHLSDSYFLFNEWIQEINNERMAEGGSVYDDAGYQQYLGRIQKYVAGLPMEMTREPNLHISLSQADGVDEQIREAFYAKKKGHSERIAAMQK